MTYVPKLPTENVNISKQHPLAELAWLLGGVLVILLGVYFLMGVAIDVTVDRLPPDFESRHLADMDFPIATDPDDPFLEPTENVLDLLVDQIPEPAYDFELAISPGNEVNAFALPGGNIVLMRALLAQASSENEVAMVLAHELGHFAHRDHLRGLGRGLVIAALSAFFMGDQVVARVLGSSLNLAQLKHGRGQETAADLYGLELLYKTYGHVGGATAFFERLQASDMPSLAWAVSHPLSEKRIETLREEIRSRGYHEGDLKPWPPIE